MQIPQWKYWLSHLYDVRLESTDSDFNEELHVVLSKGRLQLLTKNAIYSFAELYLNFYEAFKKIPLDKLNLDKVMVLGLGLGSIPYMLEEKFNKRYNYTLVEIDEQIIYLANKYVLKYLKSPQSIICADGLHFIAQHEEQYDMICMDIFLDDVVPTPFETHEFLQLLKKRLTPDGILLFNRLYLTLEDKAKTEEFYYTTFKAIFPKGDYLNVKGNWILLNRSLHL